MRRMKRWLWWEETKSSQRQLYIIFLKSIDSFFLMPSSLWSCDWMAWEHREHHCRRLQHVVDVISMFDKHLRNRFYFSFALHSSRLFVWWEHVDSWDTLDTQRSEQWTIKHHQVGRVCSTEPVFENDFSLILFVFVITYEPWSRWRKWWLSKNDGEWQEAGERVKKP